MGNKRTRLAGMVIALAIAVTTSGCGRSQPEQPHPGEQPHVAGAEPRFQITLDTGGPMRMTAAPLDVIVREDGKPITDADVSVELRMPPSGPMGEMRTGAALTPGGDGHYRGQVDMMMAGTWNAIVRVKRGGAVVATHTEPVVAQ